MPGEFDLISQTTCVLKLSLYTHMHFRQTIHQALNELMIWGVCSK